MKSLTTGQLAKQAQVNIETVRYCERLGLIPKPPRRDSGYRQYPQETVKRIQFIKRAKELGFSLKEIDELLSLHLNPNTPCSEIKMRAEAKLQDIDGKISSLQRMKKALDELICRCDGRGPATECAILGALEKNRPEGR